MSRSVIAISRGQTFAPGYCIHLGSSVDGAQVCEISIIYFLMQHLSARTGPEYGMVSHALGSGIRQMLKEYRVLTAQLESLYLSSPTFTLQTLYFHLHPTLHTMTLLASLCQALETDDINPDQSDGTDEDDDGLGGMAEELGLGGAGLKGLMKNLKAQEQVGGGGLVVGGEVLGIVSERDTTMSG